MEDEADKPAAEKSEADTQREQLVAAEEKARDVVIQALIEWGRKKAHVGYIDGYAAGRADAQKNLVEYFKTLAAQKEAQPAAPPQLPRPKNDFFELAKMAELKPREIVFGAIKATPGLRGAELLEKIRSEGIELHERTFRTQLYRLKVPAGAMPGPGHILAVNNRWYRFEDAPPEAIENVRRTREELIRMLKDPKDNGGQQ